MSAYFAKVLACERAKRSISGCATAGLPETYQILLDRSERVNKVYASLFGLGKTFQRRSLLVKGLVRQVKYMRGTFATNLAVAQKVRHLQAKVHFTPTKC